MIDTLADKLREIGVENALVMDGYDDCVIGVLERYGMEPIVLYDKEKVINLKELLERTGSTASRW